MFTCTHGHAHTCSHVHTAMNTHAFTRTQYTHAFTHRDTRAHTRTHTCICMQTHIHLCTHMNLHAHNTLMYSCTHSYTCVRTHTHTHSSRVALTGHNADTEKGKKKSRSWLSRISRRVNPSATCLNPRQAPRSKQQPSVTCRAFPSLVGPRGGRKGASPGI